MSRFEEWYAIYPRKKARAQAVKAWSAKCCDAIADQIIEATENQIAHEIQWQNKLYIPYPATYLNGERWLDEIDTEDVEKHETAITRQDRVLAEWASNQSGGEVLAGDEPDVPRGLVIDMRRSAK